MASINPLPKTNGINHWLKINKPKISGVIIHKENLTAISVYAWIESKFLSWLRREILGKKYVIRLEEKVLMKPNRPKPTVNIPNAAAPCQYLSIIIRPFSCK